MLMPKRNHNQPKGFTLIELLTVVAIIGLLVGMVIPTLRAVLENKNRMVMLARIYSLDNGAVTYKMSATGNRYYPGQDADGLGALTGSSSSRYPNCQSAGSALLARALFTDPNGAFPVGTMYGKLEDGLLDSSSDPVTGVPYSILDVDSETMAILYYPSRIGMQGNKAQYVIADNTKYTSPSGLPSQVADSETILTVVQSSVQEPVRADGEFIISAAGISSRLYFDTDRIDNLNK